METPVINAPYPDTTTDAVRALLESVSPASTRIEPGPSGWLIWAHFANGVQHGGHTGISAATPSDPVEWTREVLLPIIRSDARLASCETVAEVSQPDDSASLELGAELLADEGDAGQSAGDEARLLHDGGAEDVRVLLDERPDERPDELGADWDHDGPASGVGSDDPQPKAIGAEFDGADASEKRSQPDLAAYPGLLILPDEIGARRNAVLAAITARQLVLLDVAADPSRRDFLRDEFVRYQNAGALGLPLDETLTANYAAFLTLQSRDAAIGEAARHIARAALEADLDGLERIAQGLEDALR